MNLRQFLDLFHSPKVRDQLKSLARRPDVKALAAIRKADGIFSAIAFAEIPPEYPAGTETVWLKPSTAHSRTRHALSLVEAGETVKAAAAKAGVSTVAVYRAMKRRQGKPVCHCCGQVIRSEFTTPLPPAGDA